MSKRTVTVMATTTSISPSTHPTKHLTTLLLGVTVLVSLGLADRHHRPAAGLRKAVELIEHKSGGKLTRPSDSGTTIRVPEPVDARLAQLVTWNGLKSVSRS